MQSLEFRNITKRYAGQVALNDVTFSAQAGQVIAVCGENGAGKSTLMNLLAGVCRPDAGAIRIDGQVTAINTPQDAFSRGIHTVFQELSLLPPLSVTENLLLGRLPAKGLRVDWPLSHSVAQACLSELGFPDIDVHKPVSELSVAFQQIVEIAKALAHKPQVLVLDEPTGVLTERESRALFAQIVKLRAAGGIVLYISHRLEEVLEIADRIVVLKDGVLVDTMERADANIDRVVHSMVGRKLQDIYPTRQESNGQKVLHIENLSGPGFHDISLSLHRGEILGLFGLIGSGRTEMARALFGAVPFSAGHITLHGQTFAPRSPADAIGQGMAMVTEERKHDGLALDCDILDNGSLPTLGRFCSFGILSNARRSRAVADKVTAMSIRPTGLHHKLRKLSGGNQQKVVLAKWMLMDGLTVLILDEPTRGVDVGTKTEIYRLIADLSAQGIAILLISSELPEILGLSDRVGVLRDGALVACLPRAQCSEKTLFTHAAGV